MAQLTIAESDNIISLQNGMGQCMMLPPKAEQVLAISGSPVACLPFGSLWTPPMPNNHQIIFIRLNCDTPCCVRVGDPATNPTASTTNARLAGNQTEFFGVRQGDVLSVIATS
jgi:hypothetical protein